jgi:hypothetical protein
MTKLEKAKNTPPISPAPSATSIVETQTACLMNGLTMTSLLALCIPTLLKEDALLAE